MSVATLLSVAWIAYRDRGSLAPLSPKDCRSGFDPIMTPRVAATTSAGQQYAVGRRRRWMGLWMVLPARLIPN